jgi:hypothetical protein
MGRNDTHRAKEIVDGGGGACAASRWVEMFLPPSDSCGCEKLDIPGKQVFVGFGHVV